MAKYLLDTNACIAIRKSFSGGASADPAKRARQDRLIARWKTMVGSELAMSFITLGELAVWVEKHSTPAKARAAVQIVRVPVDDGGAALALRYGALRAELERSGNKIPYHDMWIAAHALLLNMTVVTGDRHDFGRVPNLSLEDWTA
jgi:tRNA(fMet)-specific endonuclease VapC